MTNEAKQNLIKVVLGGLMFLMMCRVAVNHTSNRPKPFTTQEQRLTDDYNKLGHRLYGDQHREATVRVK